MSLIWTLFTVAVVAAGAADLFTFRIPNAIVVILLILFGAACAVAVVNHVPVPWINHFAAGTLSLLVGLLLYGLNQMGAGDVKLLAVIALWAGLSGLVPLLLALAFAGLALLVVVLLLRWGLNRAGVPKAILEKSKLSRIVRKGEGMPYGVGIALGAIIASRAFPHWLWSLPL